MFHPTEVNPVIAIILRGRREELRAEMGGRTLSEVQIAADAKRSQPTVNHWLNLDAGERKRLGRDSFKALIARGLKFPVRECQALLWLAGFELLDLGETISLWGVEHAGEYAEYTDDELEEAILARLESVAKTMSSQISVYTRGMEDRRIFARKLADVEEDNLPTMSVSNVPPFISRPWDMLIEQHAQQPGWDQETPEALAEFLEKRYQSWQRRATDNVIRSIVSRSGIETYFTQGLRGATSQPPEDYRKHLEHWIGVIESYPKYELAFTDPVATTFILMGVRSLLVTGFVPPQAEGSRGVQALYITDPSVVLEFRMEFEHQWQSLPPESRDRDHVLSWLRALLPDDRD